MSLALDREVAELREASERIGQNLVELEIDSSRQLLEGSSLEGESAARWTAASAALTELWQWHGLLQDFIAQAERWRDGRHWDELRNQLGSESIELSSTEVPLAERSLLGSSQVTLRCTPAQLLARMSKAFDEVKSVVAQIGSAWEALIPRLDDAGRLAADCARLAEELGEGSRADLESARGQLTLLRAALTSDPLSIVASDVDRLVRSLQTIHKDLGAVAGQRQDLVARMAGARELGDAVRETVRQTRAVHDEVRLKISVPAAPQIPEMPAELEPDFVEIRALASAGRWRDAQRRLDELIATTQAQLDHARRVLAANRAPLEARNQFRALLDAYQAKAGRLGMIEDQALAEIYGRAHEALYTAPTDLALVGQLVRRYQEGLSGSQAKHSQHEARP